MPAGYQLTTRPRPQTQDGSTDSELETPQPVDIEELMAKLDPWP
jgi:Asp-tRNA(Asn)/Glu-tRNA(Gln) amidotransferase B subunit